MAKTSLHPHTAVARLHVPGVSQAFLLHKLVARWSRRRPSAQCTAADVVEWCVCTCMWFCVWAKLFKLLKHFY